MKIEELLDARSRAVVAFHQLDDSLPLNEWTAEQGKEWERLDEATATASAAIIAGWNAAEKAMKESRGLLEQLTDAAYSSEDGVLEAFLLSYLADVQPTLSLELTAALAKMEGTDED